jgi:hypothetical protein
MVKISDMDEFLHSDAVSNGDVIEIIGKGHYVSAEESAFGRPYLEIQVKLLDGKTKTWTPNKTTLHALAKAFGDDADLWISKKVKLNISRQNVRGEMVDVIYGEPVIVEEEQTIQGRIQ